MKSALAEQTQRRCQKLVSPPLIQNSGTAKEECQKKTKVENERTTENSTGLSVEVLLCDILQQVVWTVDRSTNTTTKKSLNISLNFSDSAGTQKVSLISYWWLRKTNHGSEQIWNAVKGSKKNTTLINHLFKISRTNNWSILTAGSFSLSKNTSFAFFSKSQQLVIGARVRQCYVSETIQSERFPASHTTATAVTKTPSLHHTRLQILTFCRIVHLENQRKPPFWTFQ